MHASGPTDARRRPRSALAPPRDGYGMGASDHGMGPVADVPLPIYVLLYVSSVSLILSYRGWVLSGARDL